MTATPFSIAPPPTCDDGAPRVDVFGLSEAPSRAAAWRELCDRAVDSNPFWDPDFLLPAARMPGVAPPLLAASWRGARMTALLALRRPRSGRLAPVLRGFSHDQAVYGAPLLDPLRGSADLPLVLSALRGRFPAARALLLPWIAEEDAAAGRLAAASPGPPIALGAHRRAALVGGRGMDQFVAEQGAKRRKAFGRLRRRLAERGRLESRAVRDPEGVAAACEAFAALEASGWKGRRGTAFALHPARARFLQQVTSAFAARGACRIDSLSLDGAPLAMGILLVAAGRAFYWKTAYDEDFAAYSPGVLLTLDVTARQLAESALRLTDSCAIPGHPMIDRLWPDRIDMADWWIPLGAGHEPLLALERARRGLRAAAKAAVARLRPGA